MWIVTLGVYGNKKELYTFRINASARRCFMVFVIYSFILYQAARLDALLIGQTSNPSVWIVVIWANFLLSIGFGIASTPLYLKRTDLTGSVYRFC